MIWSWRPSYRSVNSTNEGPIGVKLSCIKLTIRKQDAKKISGWILAHRLSLRRSSAGLGFRTSVTSLVGSSGRDVVLTDKTTENRERSIIECRPWNQRRKLRGACAYEYISVSVMAGEKYSHDGNSGWLIHFKWMTNEIPLICHYGSWISAWQQSADLLRILRFIVARFDVVIWSASRARAVAVIVREE